MNQSSCQSSLFDLQSISNKKPGTRKLYQLARSPQALNLFHEFGSLCRLSRPIESFQDNKRPSSVRHLLACRTRLRGQELKFRVRLREKKFCRSIEEEEVSPMTWTRGCTRWVLPLSRDMLVRKSGSITVRMGHRWNNAQVMHRTLNGGCRAFGTSNGTPRLEIL